MPSEPSKIDVHHHFYPEVLREAIEAAGGDPSGWYLPPWTLDLDADINAAIGVKTAILSCTAPGACIEKDPAKATALARACNESGASIRDAQPSRYGFFASLPSLLDTEACLQTISHAFDTLNADGVILFTRYGPRHQYLGDKAFEPVWAELSKRKAVILIHPTHPVDTALIHPSLPQPMFDYPHETGRAALNLIVTGTLQKHPGCKVILSHAGGTLPYLIHRAAGMLPHTPMSVGRSTEDLLEDARGFYFDTAISANEPTLKALLAFAKPGHVLFGSDFPNAPREAIETFTRTLDAWQFSPEEKRAVENETAIELFPRLAQYYSVRARF